MSTNAFTKIVLTVIFSQKFKSQEKLLDQPKGMLLDHFMTASYSQASRKYIIA